jgi:bifunctional DNase/RNase
MDREIKVFKNYYEIHKITDIRIVKLFDKQEKLLMIVPIEMIAVNTFFRNFADGSALYEQYSESKKEEIQMSAAHSRLLSIMEMLDGKMQKIVIDDLQNERVFATVYFTDYKDDEYNVQAEASDALALALLAQCDIYVKESMTDISKNARFHRVYWYDADDGELLNTVRDASHDELVALPSNDVKQLLEIAAQTEDFEFAARLKKANEAQRKKVEDFTKMMNKYILENPHKFIKELKKRYGEESIKVRPLNEESEDDEN